MANYFNSQTISINPDSYIQQYLEAYHPGYTVSSISYDLTSAPPGPSSTTFISGFPTNYSATVNASSVPEGTVSQLTQIDASIYVNYFLDDGFGTSYWTNGTYTIVIHEEAMGIIGRPSTNFYLDKDRITDQYSQWSFEITSTDPYPPTAYYCFDEGFSTRFDQMEWKYYLDLTNYQPAGSQLTATVYGSNESGQSDTKQFTIYVDAAVTNTAPTDISLSASSINENNSIGDIIGTFSATDAEGGTMTYTLVAGEGDADNASFTIDGDALKAAEVFDFETKSSYSIRVRSTDSESLFFEKSFEITIGDVSEAPDTPDASVDSVSFSLVNGKVRVSFADIDPTVDGVVYNSEPLPEGSVVRNLATGQKFLKKAGDEKAFIAIEITPPVAWRWRVETNAAWKVLQDA
jgi:hypothetical protein